jgi:tripartite-type tricarboxylate transporter receptor subunit TctC
MQHVPYKGGSAALTDLLGGQIEVLFEAAPLVIPFINRGELRALAVSTSNPIDTLPSVPTIASQGLPGFEAVGWMGVVGPANMDPVRVEILSKALKQTVSDPAIRAKLDSTGMLTIGGSPQEFSDFIKTEYTKWGDVIQKAGVKLEQ